MRTDPAERPCLIEIRDNLTARIAEAGQQGWPGEAEGLRVSLASAEGKLTEPGERAARASVVNLEIPAFREIAAARRPCLSGTHPSGSAR